MAEPAQRHPIDGEFAALLWEAAGVLRRIVFQELSDFLACRTPAASRVLQRRIGQV